MYIYIYIYIYIVFIQRKATEELKFSFHFIDNLQPTNSIVKLFYCFIAIVLY